MEVLEEMRILNSVQGIYPKTTHPIDIYHI